MQEGRGMSVPTEGGPVVLERPLRSTIYIPLVESGGESVLAQMVRIFRTSSWQRRERTYTNEMLMRAAQVKANSMAEGNYFSHTYPSGASANKNVRLTGYILPDWYPESGNQVEALAGGQKSAAEAFDDLLRSPLHHDFITGEDDFYKGQECFGVGYAHSSKDDSTYHDYYVVISCPCMEGI